MFSLFCGLNPSRNKMEIVKEKSKIKREKEKHTKRKKQTNRTNAKRERSKSKRKEKQFYRVETISCNVETKYHNETDFQTMKWKQFNAIKVVSLSFPFNIFFFFFFQMFVNTKHIAECWIGAQRPFQYIYGNIIFIGYFVCLNVFFCVFCFEFLYFLGMFQYIRCMRCYTYFGFRFIGRDSGCCFTLLPHTLSSFLANFVVSYFICMWLFVWLANKEMKQQENEKKFTSQMKCINVTFSFLFFLAVDYL